MKFSRLRILGFKTFVEPTDIPIEPGLTGVVGPNGCGKSNLVEALRWVMGEGSHKAMRASGMDEVIFSGSGARPARNMAEVGLLIDNGQRLAPAGFNDGDQLEVTRRIEREAGSVYRINGREVRARDVQLLFADASTGAHSPAMVGQGRIGELIAAKPQQRRALLEEAAGIAGLHGRRHDAELRLRAAEQNLGRLDDVLREIGTQLEALRRQARQAARYRSLSAEIRKTEATGLAVRWRAAREAEAAAEAALAAAAEAVAAAADAQAEAARDQAVAAAAMPALRDAAAAAAAAVQRLRAEDGQLESEARRIQLRLDELSRQGAQLDADMARERGLASDNAGMLARLDDEERTLLSAESDAGRREQAATARLAEADAALAEAERLAADAAAALTELAARRRQLRETLGSAEERARRLAAELERTEQELTTLKAASAAGDRLASARAAVAHAEAALVKAEAAATLAEQAATDARAAEANARAEETAAAGALSRAETEARTLDKLLARHGGGHRLIDAPSVDAGYEAAIAAAFGDELELSDDASLPAHWRLIPPGPADGPLPDGTEPLARRVRGPEVLARRLAQIGVVTPEQGEALHRRLRPGQALVTPQGDLWRWDGYVAGARARTAAAERLAGRNRLAALTANMELLRQAASDAAGRSRAMAAAAQRCAADEAAARQAWREAQRSLDSARQALAAAEREAGQNASRLAALSEAESRLRRDVEEAGDARARAAAALASTAAPETLEGDAARLRHAVAEQRAVAADARAAAAGMQRERESRQARLTAITTEREAWRQRIATSADHLASLEARRTASERERAEISDRPVEIAASRRRLAVAAGEADHAARRAAEARDAGDAGLVAADRKAAAALAALADAREQRGRAEERHGGTRQRTADIAARIADTLQCAPAEAADLAGLRPDSPLPAIEQVDARLERLREERERLGGVNLRAEQEADELAQRRDMLAAEKDDLLEAIGKLRQGIASLNREGRERLNAAFHKVNERFQQLFTSLFGGGTAELQFTESEDPLQAGLDIIARPPGKKPSTMTLLSGGEQALTALALIFAVFLTNPAPICVLDEVDAPLDDANVERFCALLDEMVRQTATRFLVITHNPITMARMNRLFGVTMVERGVSQLVSVDLETAERFREAG